MTRTRRLLTPSLATLAAGAMVLASAAPGMAAEKPVAQASATGLVLTLFNTPTDSGTFKATNDGKKETTTGARDPLLTAVDNQPFGSVGTLAQNASTRIMGGRGYSAACAGLAGDGATLVSVENGGNCLQGGNNIELEAGTLDLSDVRIVRGDLLAGLDDAVQALLQPLLDTIVGPVQDALQTVLTAIGDPGIVLDLGAIQSTCTSSPSGAEGDSDLTDVDLSIRFPAPVGKTQIVQFPTNPPPNTKVLTDLDVVVDAIKDGLQTQLEDGLAGALGPLSGPLGDAVDALNDNVIKAIADQLGPLEDNLLDITLNKQVRPAKGEIEVTALDASVVPAARDFGVDLIDAQIGKVACGPSGRVDDPNPPTDPPTNNPPTNNPPTNNPPVPTSIPAGADAAAFAGGSDDGDINGILAAGALALLGAASAGAGVTAYRRKVTR